MHLLRILLILLLVMGLGSIFYPPLHTVAYSEPIDSTYIDSMHEMFTDSIRVQESIQRELEIREIQTDLRVLEILILAFVSIVVLVGIAVIYLKRSEDDD